MPRAKQRARDRRRFEDRLREAVRAAQSADAEGAAYALRAASPRADNGELWRLLRDIASSGRCVWDVTRAVGCTDDEIAMIAQAVAPRLAGMTPGSVFRRHKLAK